MPMLYIRHWSLKYYNHVLLPRRIRAAGTAIIDHQQLSGFSGAIPKREPEKRVADTRRPPLLRKIELERLDAVRSHWGQGNRDFRRATLRGQRRPSTEIQQARQYKLDVIQQPRQARMCGSGDKADRRPIDPPPLLRLRVRKSSTARARTNQRAKRSQPVKSANQLTAVAASASTSSGDSSVSSRASGSNESGAAIQTRKAVSDDDDDDDENYTAPRLSHTLFCFASLVGEFDDAELYLLGKSRSKYVTGSVVSSLFHLKDQSCFVFPDLSIRTEGRWRFKMSLYEIQEDGVRYCTSVFTDTFQVYSSKRFPGMGKSTELSKSVAQQGLRLRIRRPGANREEEGEDEDAKEDPELTTTSSSRKRKVSDDNPNLTQPKSGKLTSAYQSYNELNVQRRSPTLSQLSSPAVSPGSMHHNQVPDSVQHYRTYPGALYEPPHYAPGQPPHEPTHARPQTSPAHYSHNRGVMTMAPLPSAPSHRPDYYQRSYSSEDRIRSGVPSPRLPDYRPTMRSPQMPAEGASRQADYFQPYSYHQPYHQQQLTLHSQHWSQPHHTSMDPSRPFQSPPLVRVATKSPEQTAAQTLAGIKSTSPTMSGDRVTSSPRLDEAHHDTGAGTTKRDNGEADANAAEDADRERKNSTGRGSLADLLGEGTPTVKQTEDVFFFD
ncbi:hypothetical protein OIO90_005780 [Microbotryomycetes sp. JL221]|nr:hypothetical protein OIO90_005780 [Microbotryomycetes sp. JL221]